VVQVRPRHRSSGELSTVKVRPRKQIQLGRQLKARRTDVDLTLRAVAREMTELQSSIPKHDPSGGNGGGNGCI
jgi:hypothetical protein